MRFGRFITLWHLWSIWTSQPFILASLMRSSSSDLVPQSTIPQLELSQISRVHSTTFIAVPFPPDMTSSCSSSMMRSVFLPTAFATRCLASSTRSDEPTPTASANAATASFIVGAAGILT